jgi:arylsulfatase A-like enzyme
MVRLAHVLAAVLLVAAMEALLIQWTSYVVAPNTLVIDFVASGVVLAMAVVPIIVAVATAYRKGSSWAFLTATVLALAFYDLSRIHTEKMSWQDPAIPALMVILAIGCWSVVRPPAVGAARGAADFVVAQVLVGATAVTWAVLHVGSFTPTIVVLVLLGSLTAVQVACSLWLLARERSAPPRSIVVALASLAVAIVFSMVSYPVVPGTVKLKMRSQSGEMAVAPGRLPNVIVVVMDTVRADHLSLYGYEHPTSPQLAEFAERAYVFRRAIANSDWSLPSHATLFTGLLPHQHGAHTVIASIQDGRGRGDEVGWIAQQPLPPSRKTIADRLREVGYETGLIAANHAWLADDWGLVRGFHYVENEPRSLVAFDPFCGAYLRHQPIDALDALYERSTRPELSADEIVGQATDFLGRQRGRSFFLVLNFMDAHAPYLSAMRADAVPEIRERFRGARWSAANLEAYDRSIAFLDDQLGRFFGELKARGLFEDSLIVVTADHGERFGPSGIGWHGDDLSQSTLHIPLLIKMPRQAKGERVERWAQLADVPPTILAAAGLPIPREFFGSPLGRQSRAVIAENYLSSGGTGGDTLRSHGPPRFVSMEILDEKLPTQWALFDGPWKLVRNADGRDLLYDLSDDPSESENLAARRPEIAQQMTDRLAALLPPGTFTDYRRPIAQAGVSALTIEKLKSLGYAQ